MTNDEIRKRPLLLETMVWNWFFVLGRAGVAWASPALPYFKNQNSTFVNRHSFPPVFPTNNGTTSR
ncbi:MAG: hypothetical protein QF437_01715 [Planctomycetota bacterium]|jgi:hypothetical protein|nr:hypothetical protein [Planctomycetota bacterium]MDP7248046.1 hypothetical protein [Planctomycetota bacterium]